MTLSIEIVSDVVCPWCFIGKRHLETALAEYRQESDVKPEIHWLPFQLNPDLPEHGVPRRTYLEQKFGGPERAREIYARVTQAGESAGITFNFDGIEVQPNTLEVHRLIYASQNVGKQNDLVEILFQAYFIEAANLSETATLSTLAGRAGMDTGAVEQYLASDEDRHMIRNLDHQAHQMGVSGVPFFIFNRKLAVSGAQPPAILLQAMRQVLATG
jgi:predicted DsbA family dithiol-disulfide isomerase